MGYKEFRYDGTHRLELDQAPTVLEGLDREKIQQKTLRNLEAIGQWQDKLYADGREGIVILLQAMDAAGKDSAIKHVMGCVNPQGLVVHSFKQPSAQELAHDYLWRAVQALPPRGGMAIFNRSYYEDVLVVKVHGLHKEYRMADRCRKDKDFFEKRYRQIRHFEEYLYENSYRLIKFFLHVSKEEQKKRFLERIEVPEKNWKFSQADVAERSHWEAYRRAYEAAINATATGHSPWYVLPADRKWQTRWLISQVLRRVLEEVAPQYPEAAEEKEKELQVCRSKLLAEE